MSAAVSSAPAPRRSAGDAPTTSGRPVLDVFAVLASMQQQLDDLHEAVQAQQGTLQALLEDRASRDFPAADGGAVSRPR